MAENLKEAEEKEADKFRHAKLRVEEILKEFDTSQDGLSDREAKIHLRKYGYNELVKKKRASVAGRFFSKFLNPLIIMLLIIVAFSLFFGEKISALIVSLMILVSVFLSFFLEHKSGKEVEKLIALVQTNITVYRNGREKEINIREIVPGDIIELNAGDIIPADLRIISCKDLFVNQASLTGESFPAKKTAHAIRPKSTSIADMENLAFMGSSVVNGTGLGLVVNTGASTEFGKISRALAETETATNFDTGVRDFTLLMVKLTFVLVLFIFTTILFLKQGPLKEALLFSLAVAVGLTPEMLPMLMTVNLSKGAIDMARKKVIVKHLNSIQNIGAIDVLCTDKTGTLTLNKIVLEKYCDVAGKNSEEVLKYAYINSTFHTGLKNLLDNAILKHEKFNVAKLRKIDEMPFDFTRKIMSVVIEEKKKHIVISKGSPEEILKRCRHYELKGSVHKINDKIISGIKKEYEKLSSDGFRVLFVAYRKVKNRKNKYSKEDERDLVLNGYVAFLDPAKPTAKEALTALKKLGLEIKVLTGDNEIIAKKVCKDVNLEIKGTATGAHIDALSDEELQVLAEKTTIFAHLTPAQKERVIRALHNSKHIVGYLGDGINDAASLKVSDVGISVNNAVDVAKESADIILLEKSLTVLKEGVVEGRKIFSNIIKYIKTGASSNFGNMLSMTGATLFIPFLPMLPIQILLNNFLYDMSQVSLPTDEVDKEYLAQPRQWDMDIIRKFILFIGPLSSIFDFVTFGILLFAFKASSGIFQTGWFVVSLCTQVLIIYIIRTNRIPFVESRPSNAMMLTTLLVLFAGFAILFSPLAKVFGFVQLPAIYFVILPGIVIAYLTLVHFVKKWFVKKYGYQ